MIKPFVSFHVSRIKKAIEKMGSNTTLTLRGYRYGSWFITSMFYVLGPPHSPLFFKVGVAVSLGLAIKPTLCLYEEGQSSQVTMVKLMIIETLGIALLLIPTGKLDSPFIWYALNPVLVAASFLPFYLSWLNLITYLIISILIIGYRQGLSINNIVAAMASYTETLMVFLLITLAFQLHAQLAAYLSKQADKLTSQKLELVKTNMELAKANSITRDFNKHVTALYQSVEAFCSHDNTDELAELFTRYASVLTGGLNSGFWLWEGSGRTYTGTCSGITGKTDKVTDKKISNIIMSLKNDQRLNSNGLFRIAFTTGDDSRELVCVPIRSTSQSYGIIAVLSNIDAQAQGVSLDRTLTFLARLCAITLERIRLEEIADTLLLSEEQNRIAEEIHDTVSQRLFSISFALHAVSAECQSISPEDLKKQVSFIQKSLKKASRELRSSIYGLSSRKNGDKVFARSIYCYLNELAKLNKIETVFEMNGSEDMLDSSTRIACYRVIREATANAIRHGGCSTIKVSINISAASAIIKISDNGKGFDHNAESEKNTGLGLCNMEKLVRSVNGQFEITSSPGTGTLISCRVPNVNTILRDVGGS